MKEICTLLVKLYIICSRMQRVNLHARPSIIQVGCPTCCYQVCALDHERGVLQTWFIIQSPVVVMYGDQLALNCSGYAAMTMPWSAGFVASKTETKYLQLYLVSRKSPGWGQSHIFWTCPGKPVVWFYRERSDFFRTSIVERTSGGDFVN